MSAMSSYSPPDWTLHGVGRFGEESEIRDGMDTESYGKGVGINAGIWIAVGLLLFIILFFMYACACCCRCACFKTKKLTDKKKKIVHVGFFIMTAMLVALAVFGCFAVSATTSGAADVARTATRLQDLAQDIDTQGNQLDTSLVAGITVVDDFLAQDPGNADLTAIRQSLEDSRTATADAIDTAVEAVDGGDDLEKQTDDIQNSAEIAGWIYISFSAVWAILMVITSFKIPCGQCCFRVLLFVGIFLCLLMWIFVGVLFGSGIALSDGCVSPDQSVLELVDGADADLKDSITYYLQCDVNPGLSPGGVLASVTDAQALAQDAQDDVDSLAYPSNPTNDALKADLDAAIAQIIVDVDLLADLALCGGVNPIWRSFRDSLCNDTLKGILDLWVSQAIAAVIMVIAIIYVAPFYNNHPNAASQRKDADPRPPLPLADVEMRPVNPSAPYSSTPQASYPQPPAANAYPSDPKNPKAY